MVGTVWPDLRVAVRLLLRSPGFSLTAILTLAVGMSATTLVFTAINAVLLRPLPVEEPDRMIAVSTVGEMAFLQQEPLAFGDYLDLARAVPAFESVVAHRRAPSVIGMGVGSRIALGENVSANYFTGLGVPLAIGRPFTPDDDPDAVVVLSHSVWRQRFGRDPRIVGRDVELGGRSRRVVGVAPEGFTGLFRGIAPEFWIPIRESAIVRSDSRRTLQWWVHARLRRNAGMEQAGAQVAGLARALAERYPDSNGGRTFRLERLADTSAHPAVPKALVSAGALGVLAVALLVLIVASANVANLVLARAAVRQREIAIRTAIGATRWRIVRQLLVEGVVLAACAATVALFIASWAGRALSAVPLPIAIGINLNLTPDWRVVAFTATVALLTAVLFSVGPAVRASRQPVLVALMNDARTSTGAVGVRCRTMLLSAQAAVAMLLLILGGLAVRSLAATTRADPGFDTERVIVAAASPGLVEYDRERALNFMAEAAARVRGLPGVQAAGWMHPVPLSLNIRITRLRLPGQEGVATRELSFVDAAIAWPGAFEALRIPVIEGRDFNDRDRVGEMGVALVNESFARRYWPGQRPIGQRIAIGFPDTVHVEIVGVVRDFKSRTLGDVPRPMVFTSGLQDLLGWQAATLMIRQSEAQGLAMEAVIRAVRGVDPVVPVYDVQPLTARMGGVLLLPRYTAALFGGIGLLSLSLIAVGLFGTVSFSVHSRTRELGVRLALGSARCAIIWLVARQTLVPIVLGAALGLAGGLLGSRALTALLYGVSPQDPMTVLVGVLILVVTTLAASAWPAWRAARLDPMQALRTE
ncbi:MAG: ABC transporter permease [Acidobacteria bacterium]|nr:ABC transporter permease [Acidobacteriota bacterium]